MEVEDDVRDSAAMMLFRKGDNVNKNICNCTGIINKLCTASNINDIVSLLAFCIVIIVEEEPTSVQIMFETILQWIF